MRHKDDYYICGKDFKRCFTKKEIPWAIDNEVRKSKGLKLYSYHCTYCNDYHLTRQKQYEKKTSTLL